MTIIVCIIWGVLVVLTALAFWRGKILKSSPEDVLKDTRSRIKAERDVEKAQSGSEAASLKVNPQSRSPSPPVVQNFYLLNEDPRTASYLP